MLIVRVIKSLCAVVLYFSLCYPVNAGIIQPCSENAIVSELIQLNLDPEIKTNADLLKDLKVKYGEAIYSHFVNLHSSLVNDKNGKIDAPTVKWVAETIWSPENPLAKNILIVGNIQKTAVLNDYVEFLVNGLYQLSEKLRLIFKSEQDRVYFKKHAIPTLINLMKIQNPLVTHDVIQLATSTFEKYILHPSANTVGFAAVQYANPTIIIFGQGAHADNSIAIGGVNLTTKHLVKVLNKLNIPSDATVKLESCLSACSQSTLNYSIAEILVLFHMNRLVEYAGPIKGSLLDSFAKEIFRTIPSFNGIIEGYIGKIFIKPQKNVLKRNGVIMDTGNASQIDGIDGHVILKKEEVRVQIVRSDIFPK